MKAKEARDRLHRLEQNVETIIRGKNEVVRMSIVALLAGGHMLFEDVPGVGKTTLAHCLAHSLGLSFQRIQFTSDLLPSDILGVTVYDQRTHAFDFMEGPIFANIVLVDEINRTTPKTQSALLEAMNTAQVSIEKTTHDLPSPFLVMATQNPVESHGTFPLPHSQLDRFLIRLNVGYPEPEHEIEILMNQRRHTDFSHLETVLSREEVIEMQSSTNEVKVEKSLIEYIVALAQKSREMPSIEQGISTRGALALRRGAQAHAYLEGRDYCTPDDIKAMAVASLAHRIVPAETYEAGKELIGAGTTQIAQLLEEVKVPV